MKALGLVAAAASTATAGLPLFYSVVLLAAGAVTASLASLQAPRPASDAIACSAPARPLVRRELIFGTMRSNGRTVGEQDWQSFLDSDVTPRFPDGFTVLDGRGQWRGTNGLQRERSRVLVIWHAPSRSHEADIEAIRSAYKQRFDQDSVMRIDGVSCVAF
jgi:hypothetical protein